MTIAARLKVILAIPNLLTSTPTPCSPDCNDTKQADDRDTCSLLSNQVTGDFIKGGLLTAEATETNKEFYSSKR